MPALLEVIESNPISSESANTNQEAASGPRVPDLRDAQAALEIMREEVAKLERSLAMARGTRELAPMPAFAPAPLPAPEPPRSRPLPERVQDALASRTLGVAELAKVLGEPALNVVNVVRALAGSRRVHNVGSADHPRWTAVVGDGAPNEVLHALVSRLLSEQPMTTAELVAATGARESRISGYLVHLQRSTTNLLNLGNPRVGRWMLVPSSARLAILRPKARVRRR